MVVRVVAGEARGRTLVAPSGSGTRPTGDRVRESIFNMLFSLGATEGAEVLDLYAGCGALGIEALSRGAASCTFVEQDHRAVRCIETNLETTGFGDSATVLRADAVAWVTDAGRRFDLVLADPPYADDDWVALLDVLDARWVVAEGARPLEPHPRWHVAREKTYGTTFVTVLESEGGLT